MNEVDFLHFIIENIVNGKDAVKIDKTDDELGTLLTLKVDKEDM
jgi:predicted RNA-binding protein YlqC (UPF0109 family)